MLVKPQMLVSDLPLNRCCGISDAVFPLHHPSHLPPASFPHLQFLPQMSRVPVCHVASRFAQHCDANRANCLLLQQTGNYGNTAEHALLSKINK